MMAEIRAAVVKDGVVTSVLIVEDVEDAAVTATIDGDLIVSDEANIGDAYDEANDTFTPPPEVFEAPPSMLTEQEPPDE